MTKRILITRLSHIGDCVLTLPLANAIKRHLPTAKLTWIVEKPSDQLLALNPNIDEIVTVPKGWLKSPRSIWETRRRLRKRKFDIAIDPQGISKSAMLGWLSGAPQRWGVKGRWGRELSPWLNNRLIETKSEHVVDRSLDLSLAMVKSILPGNSVNDNRDLLSARELFQMEPDRESVKTVDRWLSKLSPGRFVVVNPGASWASKRWELDRFAKVIEELSTRHRFASLLTWAGDQEYQMVQEIASQTSKAVVAPSTTLSELGALCQLAEFFVGCDTGPLHIASAVGARCVGLYGTTRPTESGAYGAQHLAIQERYQEGSCRERRNANNEAMREISVERVVREIDTWIATWRSEAA